MTELLLEIIKKSFSFAQICLSQPLYYVLNNDIIIYYVYKKLFILNYFRFISLIEI